MKAIVFEFTQNSINLLDSARSLIKAPRFILLEFGGLAFTIQSRINQPSLGGGRAFTPFIPLLFSRLNTAISLRSAQACSTVLKLEFSFSLCIKVVSELKPGEFTWFALFNHFLPD